MHRMELCRPAALGAGSRHRGDLLALLHCQPHQAVAAAHRAVGPHVPPELACEVEPAPGVEPIEILTALRNPQLCVFIDEDEGTCAPDGDDSGFATDPGGGPGRGVESADSGSAIDASGGPGGGAQPGAPPHGAGPAPQEGAAAAAAAESGDGRPPQDPAPAAGESGDSRSTKGRPAGSKKAKTTK